MKRSPLFYQVQYHLMMCFFIRAIRRIRDMDAEFEKIVKVTGQMTNAALHLDNVQEYTRE